MANKRAYCVIKNKLQIILPYIPLKNDVYDTNELETECLFGEIFVIEKETGSWVWGTLETDGYKGWVKKKYLDKPMTSNYKISSIVATVHFEPKVRSNTIFNLSLNALLTVIEIKRDWAKIKINKGVYEYDYGFVHTNHIKPKKTKILDWVSYTEKFIGIPYKWGGRSYNGIDCSALLQLSLSSAGICVKRNCNEQKKLLRKYPSNHNVFCRGDIFFWKRHVGIGLNSNEIIHANGFHMKTIVEKRKTAIDRIYFEEGELIAKYNIPVL